MSRGRDVEGHQAPLGVLGRLQYGDQRLIILTVDLFPATFYSSDALGHLNSWMRLICGILLGIDIVWFTCLRLDASIDKIAKPAAIEIR